MGSTSAAAGSGSEAGLPSGRLKSVLQRLDALINWERRGRGRMRVTLEPARDLCRRLGEPQRFAHVVHVTGSKGKGSVSSLVAAALSSAGLRMGRYGSPHVERIQERVVVDGRQIDDESLADGLERALAAREQALAEGTAAAQATWFDLLTSAAWCALREARVDWLVAECGLGGRFDSTNTLSGEVCVVTTVELEHTSVLGSTRAAIAAEKAGILKPGSTLVTGVDSLDEAGRELDAAAGALDLCVLRPAYLAEPELPSIEARNVALAGLVLDELGRRGHAAADGRPLAQRLLTPDLVRAARLPARLERLQLGPLPVVLDGAHTPDSVRDLLRDLLGATRTTVEAARGLSGKPVAILGVGRDKDLPGLLKRLQGGADRVVCTSVGGPLARSPEEIAEAARSAGLAAETAATPRMALDRARELTPPHGWILVLGSLYLAGAVRPLLERAAADPAC